MRLIPRSKLIFLALLCLPALLLAGWFVHERAPVWFSGTPDWLNPSSDAAVPGACEAQNALRVYRGRYVSDTPTINAADARARVNAIVAEHYALPEGSYSLPQGPALVRAAFPQAGERLAWLALANPETGEPGRLGKVAIVFLDAESGDLLALHTAMSATDPRIACGGGPVSRRVLLRQYLPLLLAVGYMGLVASGWIIVRLRHKGRSGMPAGALTR